MEWCPLMTYPKELAVQFQKHRFDDSIKPGPFSSIVQCQKVFFMLDETLLLVNKGVEIPYPVAHTPVISF